ncbi:hypothetical protein BN1221_03760c [Brenneria goodwinii]|uniref:Uncharacterized protein n=1 Tax=Brenneria goodwinii TaxID=1109412 RepID=A0A0G4JZA9_9GAMM|nr:hypothetical protein BN1221_03760c [Brenneria goodwinii]
MNRSTYEKKLISQSKIDKCGKNKLLCKITIVIMTIMKSCFNKSIR